MIPRSRGGLHTGERRGLVRRCNAKKEDRTPQEAASLLRQPYAPRDGFHLTLGRLEPGWELHTWPRSLSRPPGSFDPPLFS